MTFGEFLGQVFEWLYRFWPCRIVSDWEQGVRCRLGRATALLTSTNGLFGTGLHFFWPLAGEIHTTETNIEVEETALQTHTTSDSVPVSFALGVQYRIRDMRQMYLHIHDPAETIENAICATAGTCVTSTKHAELPSLLCGRVMEETHDLLGEWGIEVLSVSLMNFSRVRPVRLLTDKARPGSGFHA